MKYIKTITLFLFYISFFYLSKALLFYLLNNGYLDFLPNLFFDILDIILYSTLIIIFLSFLRKNNVDILIFREHNYCYFFLALILGALFRVIEDPFFNPQYIDNVNINSNYKISYILMINIVSIVIIGPFLEELVFRKMMLSYLGKNFVGLLLSSGLFALIHSFNGFDTIKVISSFLFGIILGLIYLKNGLFYSLLSHSFYNIIFFMLNYHYNELYRKFLLKLNFGVYYWLIVGLSLTLMLSLLIRYYLPVNYKNKLRIK